MLDEAVLASGNVELWLGELLRVSRKSVHSVIRAAAMAIDDPQFKLIEFENTFASQVSCPVCKEVQECRYSMTLVRF